MREELFNEISGKLSVFSLETLRNSMKLLDYCFKNKITIEELIAFKDELTDRRIKSVNEREQQTEEFFRKMKACPKCGKGLQFREISIPKGPRNKNGWTFQWFCLNENCIYEKYTHDQFKAVHQKYEKEFIKFEKNK